MSGHVEYGHAWRAREHHPVFTELRRASESLATTLKRWAATFDGNVDSQMCPEQNIGRYFVQKCCKKYSILSILNGNRLGFGGLRSGERATFRILRAYSLKGSLHFDLGSNKGQFLELILTNIGTTEYQIHCFEPATGNVQDPRPKRQKKTGGSS
jgi:hypothetical protein